MVVAQAGDYLDDWVLQAQRVLRKPQERTREDDSQTGTLPLDGLPAGDDREEKLYQQLHYLSQEDEEGSVESHEA